MFLQKTREPLFAKQKCFFRKQGNRFLQSKNVSLEIHPPRGLRSTRSKTGINTSFSVRDWLCLAYEKSKK
jgi:hypothetical protein